MMNKAIATLAATIMILLATATVFAAPAAIGVTIDGKAVAFTDAAPYIDSASRTMIPVRVVTESVGATVAWNNDTRTVAIVRGDKTVELVIGQKGIKVNKVGSLMDTAAQITNSRTYVPLRFVSEAFGMGVKWDGNARMVAIVTNPQPGTADGTAFGNLRMLPITTLDQKANSKYFTVQAVAEAKKSTLPVKLQFSTIEGVYKDTQDNMFVLKLSSDGYPGGIQYSLYRHFVLFYLKDGTIIKSGPVHLDQGAVKLHPALTGFANVATEQQPSALGAHEWAVTYHTREIAHDFDIKQVTKIAVWDDVADRFGGNGEMVVISVAEIPEI